MISTNQILELESVLVRRVLYFESQIKGELAEGDSVREMEWGGEILDLAVLLEHCIGRGAQTVVPEYRLV